ncbi:MAG: methyltransferase domain-containing protein [Azoarcus sp.]|nr:methyltransferase domain-containing protein [Azoarcus sp.]
MNIETVFSPTTFSWLRTPPGEYLLAWEQARLDAMLANIFGYNALQVGLAEVDLLRASRIPLHVCASRAAQNARNDENGASISSRLAVGGDETALPFAGASLDLVVLAHELEFSAAPHQILREAGRVLVAEGSVVILGFNPYSLWACRRSRNGLSPWRGRTLSAGKVRDWLTVLGFEVQMGQFGCYAPPVESSDWLNRWKWLDWVGQRCWPVCGAAWILHGIKRVHGVRRIQPNWREKTPRARALSAVARKLGESGSLPDRASGKIGKT